MTLGEGVVDAVWEEDTESQVEGEELTLPPPPLPAPPLLEEAVGFPVSLGS